MLYRASVLAAILAAGARAGEDEVCMDDDVSGMEEAHAESSALQVKLEAVPDGEKYSHNCNLFWITLNNFRNCQNAKYRFEDVFSPILFQNKASCLCHIHIRSWSDIMI